MRSFSPGTVRLRLMAFSACGRLSFPTGRSGVVERDDAVTAAVILTQVARLKSEPATSLVTKSRPRIRSGRCPKRPTAGARRPRKRVLPATESALGAAKPALIEQRCRTALGENSRKNCQGDGVDQKSGNGSWRTRGPQKNRAFSRQSARSMAGVIRPHRATKHPTNWRTCWFPPG